MKRHLFYTFLSIFVVTTIITLLGVIGVLRISQGHLTMLLSAFLVELAGALVALFRRTEFFAEDEHTREIMALKKSYETYMGELEQKYRDLVEQSAQEHSYSPDLSWPGTAIKNADPQVRVCYHCLLIKHVPLPLIWDPDNKRWGCSGCHTQLNKLE